MRISQRSDHTLRALTYLAQHEWGDPVPAGTVADALGLPRRFVETQFSKLAHEGILTCRRGTGGGCSLARDASDISVRDVIVAVEGDVLDVPHVTRSAASEVWEELRDWIDDRLDVVSLADLAARQDRLDATAAHMYHI